MLKKVLLIACAIAAHEAMAADSSIPELERRILAAAKPEQVKVSIALAGCTPEQSAKNPTP
jgi:hypothetical protein